MYLGILFNAKSSGNRVQIPNELNKFVMKQSLLYIKLWLLVITYHQPNQHLCQPKLIERLEPQHNLLEEQNTHPLRLLT